MTEEAKKELEDLGEDVSDFQVATVSKLNQQIKDLTRTQDSLGVSLLDMNGNYRSTYEILLDIAKVWDTIKQEDLVTGENRQNALLEMMAGKNRSNILASILDSPDVLESAYKSALDSENSAQDELSKYLDSVDGRITQFQNRLQELANDSLDADFLKNLIDFGTKFINVLDKLIDKTGILTPLLGTLGGVFAKQTGLGKRNADFYKVKQNNRRFINVERFAA